MFPVGSIPDVCAQQMQQLRETLCLVCGLCFTFSPTVSACNPWTQRAICTPALKTTTIVPTQGCWATAAMRTQQIAHLTCAAHKDVSQWVLHPTQTRQGHISSLLPFLFCFVSSACRCFRIILLFANAAEKKFSMSRSPLTAVSAVVMNHSPSHRSWVCLPFYKCVHANKHTSPHRPHRVWFIFCFQFIFLCHYASCWAAKKKLRLLRYLLETISKLPSFTKAAVIAYDL